MHINPKFANRPLPSIPPPKPARTSLVRTQTSSASQISQPEPIYAKLNDPSLNIDPAKKESFEESIRKKVLINPNFPSTVVTRRSGAGSAAPSKPVRHSMMVTSDMTKHLDKKLKKVKLEMFGTGQSCCSYPRSRVSDRQLLRPGPVELSDQEDLL